MIKVVTLFSGYDSQCLAAPIPRTQHAKLAGNSIVVACLYYIFRNLFVNTEPEAGTQTKLF
jgi:hypothetical protein